MDDAEIAEIFTDSILRRIDPEVRATLLPAQLSAIREAILTEHFAHRHPVDIRGTIPLLFARYYYVLVLGRDRRGSTTDREATRRKKTALVGGGIFFLVALSPLVLLGFLCLYFLKSVLDINLFADMHLWDLFQ